VRRDVVWSARARRDYAALLRYLAEHRPHLARGTADRIEAAAAGLGEFATGRRGRVPDTFERLLTPLPYILAYAIADRPAGGELIVVLHITHAARDWRPGEWPPD
jgi:toxin ParE1/3/4